MVNVQLPDSASAERTIAVMDRLETIAHETPGVEHTQAMSGQSLVMNASGSNFASLFVILDDFSERRDPLSDRVFRLLNLNARQAWYGAGSGGRRQEARPGRAGAEGCARSFPRRLRSTVDG